MVLIDCPHCGKRNQTEFRYGGEYNPRPAKPLDVNDEDWADYVYMRDNKWGVQKEWWYHGSGCQTWFTAERHTRSNVIDSTNLWEPSK